MSGPAPDFEAEPYDLVAEMPRFTWPTVVLSGGRDLTTPPAVAERVAALIPGATLVRLPSAAHSVIDFRERAAFEVIAAVTRGEHDRLPQRCDELDLCHQSRAAAAHFGDRGGLRGRERAAGRGYFMKPTLV